MTASAHWSMQFSFIQICCSACLIGSSRTVLILGFVQSQHDELEAKFFEERAALEAKYQKLYEPLYSKVCMYRHMGK